MKITIMRYDPAVDSVPYEAEYDVPYKENMTVLETIMHIHENYEAIGFDYTCRGRLCGRCSVTYDGTPVFACIQFVKDGKHTIAPLEGFPVLHDLIVDKRRAHAEIAKTYERVRIAPLTDAEINDGSMTADLADQLHMLEYCCRCQVCTAGCPAKKETPTYVGPSKMIAIAYRYFDPYDQADRLVEAVQAGLWDCQMCGTCDMLCQNSPEIHHKEVFQKLRDAAEEKGLKPAGK
ncbi:MAG: 2Fe-2S iron-sulfur cluster-binding protein [Raoultibacter sp.]